MSTGSIRAIVILIAAGLALLFLLVYGNNALQVSRYPIAMEKLPRDHPGLRILHLSDLHGKEFGRRNSRLAAAIIGLEPDLILINGDMIDSHGDDGSAFVDLLKGLNGRYPVYCSLGNHEQIVRDSADPERYERFARRVREAGAVILDNERIAVERGGVTFGIYGFTAMLYHYSSHSVAELWEGSALRVPFIEERLGRPRDGEVAILLAHNPKYFQEYVEWGPDLVCAGHVHGGVVRLPFKGGVLSPDQTLFPPYSAGLYRSGGTAMHVSRGLGNSAIPLRLLNRPDLSLLELQP